MQVSFVDNIIEKLIDILAPKLAEAKSLRFAVAFVSNAGITLVEPYLTQCLERGGEAEFIVGLDFLNTEPDGLRQILNMQKQGLPVQLYCCSDPTNKNAGIYHPKLYLAAASDFTTIVVGSSNLTEGGLKNNFEINAMVQAESSEEVVSDAYAVYNRLKFKVPRVSPDPEMLDLYESLRRVSKETATRATRDRAIADLEREFADKVSTMTTLRPTPADLFGWQKIVFDKLPIGVFRTSDLYEYEGEFARFYPENRHIRDKTRQILQQLEDLGLLKHMATGYWEKSAS